MWGFSKCTPSPQRGDAQPLENKSQLSDVGSSEHRHGAQPGSRHASHCTDGPLACPVAEITRKKLGRRRATSQKKSSIFCIGIHINSRFTSICSNCVCVSCGLIPCIIFALFIFPSPSLLGITVVTQARGHLAGFPPSPKRYAPSFLSREGFSPFSLVDSHRIALDTRHRMANS